MRVVTCRYGHAGENGDTESRETGIESATGGEESGWLSSWITCTASRPSSGPSSPRRLTEGHSGPTRATGC